MKDSELQFDRSCHVLYSKPCKKEILAKIALHYPEAEREAVRTVPVAPELRDPAYARERLAAMLGPQMQAPPAFSAISVNGVRAYKYHLIGKVFWFNVQMEY